jgi:serine phosphatase RsbU (regulator of sigma subunit)
MPILTLRKTLGKDGVQALQKLLRILDPSISVLDQDGSLLAGAFPNPAYTKHPILLDGQPVGEIASASLQQQQEVLAEFFAFWLSKEIEKRNLAAEVLDNYRELHLFYRFSEKLTASLSEEVIAQMSLDEICPLIHAFHGVVALLPENQDGLRFIAEYGETFHLKPIVPDTHNLIHRVLSSGLAEVSNELPAQDYFEVAGEDVISLLCAPLKTEKRMLGIVVLVGNGQREFTAGDLKLVNAIAMQTAPALEIAYLHQLELEKARLERDLQTARKVQSGLLPHTMPVLDGWRIAAHWQPARMVSGDLYDFLPFTDGKLGIVVADVTDKGVPAALVMANTRSVLRAVATIANRGKPQSPGRVLARVNKVLCKDMPLHMFVTCLMVILDPVTGRIAYANAGHNLPYHRSPAGVRELRATGVPLGVFANATYEDKEAYLNPGESLLMYSDGLVEAHNSAGEMFDYWRLRKLLAYQSDGQSLNGENLIQSLIKHLNEFAGPAWEQEDDVTMVALERQL